MTTRRLDARGNDKIARFRVAHFISSFLGRVSVLETLFSGPLARQVTATTVLAIGKQSERKCIDSTASLGVVDYSPLISRSSPTCLLLLRALAFLLLLPLVLFFFWRLTLAAATGACPLPLLSLAVVVGLAERDVLHVVRLHVVVVLPVSLPAEAADDARDACRPRVARCRTCCPAPAAAPPGPARTRPGRGPRRAGGTGCGS